MCSFSAKKNTFETNKGERLGSTDATKHSAESALSSLKVNLRDITVFQPTTILIESAVIKVPYTPDQLTHRES
jgi:hypothetical protein